MAKFLADSALDALLARLDLCDKATICEGQPATYAAATTAPGTGNKLGEVAIDSGDFTKANGDTSGRKSTFAQQTGVSIATSSATAADHLALVDDGGSELILVTTITAQPVTAGNTATINSFKLEVADII